LPISIDMQNDIQTLFVKDNSSVSIDPEFSPALNLIANKTIKELLSVNDNLLVHSNSVKDKIEDKTIFNLHSNHSLHTSNLVGFIGVNNVRVNIGSRFSEENGNQYFIQYMLQKVYKLNLFDFNTTYGQANMWEHLLYFIFPIFLNKAYHQGLFKAYQKRFYNDSNVKGHIDIATHIKLNRPFKGNIAYNNKELSFNNPVINLIRHTIEHISCKNGFSQVLISNNDTIAAVKAVKSVTPDYHIRDRHQLILKNYKRVTHPFFTEYEPLRKLCIQILTNEGLSYHNTPNKVYGLLIDASWLWEEYLNTILHDLGFSHPDNRTRTGRLHLFTDSQELYPDFYCTDRSLVIDAKYKHFQFDNKDDIYQLITYMYRLQAQQGILMYPASTESKLTKNLHQYSYGGEASVFKKYGLTIPSETIDYNTYVCDFKSSESALVTFLEGI